MKKLKIQSTAKKQKGTVQDSSGTQLDQVAQGAQPSPNHGENGEEGGKLKSCVILDFIAILISSSLYHEPQRRLGRGGPESGNSLR
jgi:hypothetical protein